MVPLYRDEFAGSVDSKYAARRDVYLVEVFAVQVHGAQVQTGLQAHTPFPQPHAPGVQEQRF